MACLSSCEQYDVVSIIQRTKIEHRLRCLAPAELAFHPPRKAVDSSSKSTVADVHEPILYTRRLAYCDECALSVTRCNVIDDFRNDSSTTVRRSSGVENIHHGESRLSRQDFLVRSGLIESFLYENRSELDLRNEFFSSAWLEVYFEKIERSHGRDIFLAALEMSSDQTQQSQRM